DMTVCPFDEFKLSTDGVSTQLDGLTYQWQSSEAGENDWTDIEGADNMTYKVVDGIAEETDYRLVVTCENSQETATSDVIHVTMNDVADCYCEPGGSTSYYISEFSLTG